MEPCVHKKLGGPMVEHVRRHTTHPAGFIRYLRHVWQQLAKLHSHLAVSLKFTPGTEQLFCSLEKGKALAFHEAGRRRLTVEVPKLGLV